MQWANHTIRLFIKNKAKHPIFRNTTSSEILTLCGSRKDIC